jgi:hypothetical protein
MKCVYKIAMINLIMVSVFYFYGCTMNSNFTEPVLIGYDLSKPDQVWTLPDTLREISGLAMIDKDHCACIQDENGILFIYDFAKSAIEAQYVFGDNGDYEGIAKVDASIFVMRSDGVLFEILDYKSGKLKVVSINPMVPAEDNEGLCYDRDHNRLLIAVKGKANDAKEQKDQRLIFGFDLRTRKLQAEPAFNFNIETMRSFAKANHIELPNKIKKSGEVGKPILKFKTSAIAIHPITKKLYLISADDHLLFVFSMNGQIEQMVQLDSSLFNKAEGITFSENGDLYISNEAQGNKASILKFNYH